MKKSIIKITPHFVLKYLYNRKKRKLNNYYKGNTVECTICKSKYKLFRPYGIVERKNARCPSCNSLERHRLLWKYLNEKTDLLKVKDPIKVLHFAPEAFFYKIFDNMSHIDYVPCDLFTEKYRYLGKAEVQRIDITNIKYEDNYFDFIICNHVLEHIPDDMLAISELYRVMKKGGFGIFQVPINYDLEYTYEDKSLITPEERLDAFGQEDHVRIYGRDYKCRLEQEGIEVLVDDFIKTFSEVELFKFGFEADELIYYCKKVNHKS